MPFFSCSLCVIFDIIVKDKPKFVDIIWCGMKKRDFIFVGCVLLIAFICFLLSASMDKEKGKTVMVTLDGDLYGEYLLGEEANVDISSGYGHNVILINNGYVEVTEADCADHICEKTGRISQKGEVICCLPHKLIIEIQ